MDYRDMFVFVLNLMQGCLLIAIAPAVSGLIRRIHAHMLLRQGPSIWQPYRDLYKLSLRPVMRPETTSLVFAIAPTLIFSIYAALAFMLPVYWPYALISADLILVIALLGLARFIICLAGLDCGTSIAGMGAGREMFFYFLTEIGLILFAAACMILWNTTALSGTQGLLMKQSDLRLFLQQPELMLLGIALALFIVSECGRLPIDNRHTLLELTMAQQACVLDYAGRDLALIEYAEMIKLVVLMMLFGGLFLPLPGRPGPANALIWMGLLGLVIKLALLVLLMVGWELLRQKIALRSVFSFSLAGIALNLIAILYAITTMR